MLVSHEPYIKLGEPFIKLLTVDSTNNYAYNLIKEGFATNGTAIFTNMQTNGKGQMNKAWLTNSGENIILSIIVDISFVQLQNQFCLVAMAALGCNDFFKKYAGDSTAIKWSNDLYWNDKKAGGILIETIHYKNKRFAIVGIGININQTAFDTCLINPVSLKQITGKTFNVIDLCKELCNDIDSYYKLLMDCKFDLLLEQYNLYLYKKNKEVTLKNGNIKFNCIIKSVNAFGELVVENGITKTFKFGEVQFVIN